MGDQDDRLLTPAEVAALFRVDPKTVTRWAGTGRLARIRTPGGHSRFRKSEVQALLQGEPAAAKADQQHSAPPAVSHGSGDMVAEVERIVSEVQGEHPPAR